MSSMQFNYFADEAGEKFIKKSILKKFGDLYARTYFGDSVYDFTDEASFDIDFKKLYLTPKANQDHLTELEGSTAIHYREHKILEYSPGRVDEKGVFISGRLAYFAGNKFPEFKKEVQRLFRTLKKNCWKDKKWQSWIFETIGDEATIFIPNQPEHVTRE